MTKNSDKFVVFGCLIKDHQLYVYGILVNNITVERPQ